MIEWVHNRCVAWPVIGDTEIASALERMKITPDMERASEVFEAHYVARGKPKANMAFLGIDKFTYWRSLHAAHCFLAARITQPLAQSA